MEVNSTMVHCPSCGRSYDGAQHPTCPYCGGRGGNFIPTEAPGGAGGSFIPTEAPGGAGGRFTPTEAPGGVGNFSPTEAPGSAGYAGGFGVTLPPEGGDGSRFMVETEIGGVGAWGGIKTPVVGWLVCIEGPDRGSDYRLHAGYNYIGRESGDIRIKGDGQISRQNHAMVAYDSGEHLYFVGPYAGRNLIKVNGHAVLQAVEIHNYDVISIGTTRLIFVGLCGDHFSWEDREPNHG